MVGIYSHVHESVFAHSILGYLNNLKPNPYLNFMRLFFQLPVNEGEDDSDWPKSLPRKATKVTIG